jgi:hypothetical protein
MLLLASEQVRCKLAPLAAAWAPADFVLKHLMFDWFAWAREGVSDETAGQPVQCPSYCLQRATLVHTTRNSSVHRKPV